MSRHPFDLLMELDDAHIRLDCAALHLSRDRYSEADLQRALAKLDALADEVLQLRPGLGANLRYDALKSVIVDKHRFIGREDDYYNPKHCYLERVLESGHGLPITLSIVWIEIARRLKWPVSGVALPGHFIVRIDDSERFILADPFYGGRTLSLKDCRELVRQQFGNKVRFSRSLLEPVGVREILSRLLRNLRNVYLSKGELGHVLPVLQRLTAVEPREDRHLEELAAVFCRIGDIRQAYAHLTLYLNRNPDGQDSGRVRDNLRQLRAALAAQN